MSRGVWIALAVGMFGALLHPSWLVDDAWIYLHYAKNVVEHGELTYTIGEPPVEGFTGILQLVPSVFAGLLGLSMITAVQVSGQVGYLLTLLGLARVLGDVPSRVPVMLLAATAPFLYTHAGSGLETMVFAALFVWAAHFLQRVVDEGRGAWRLGFTLTLLAATRTEGILIGAFFATWALYKTSHRRTVLLTLMATFGLPALAGFAWRASHFGYLFPNPVYVKSGHRLVTLGSVKKLLLFGVQYLAIPTLGAAALVRTRPRTWRTADSALVGAAGLLLAGYLGSELLMNFSHRFFVPIYVVALVVLARVTANLPLRKMALIIAVQGLLGGGLLVKERYFASMYQASMEAMHIPVGRDISRSAAPDAWVAVVIDAGAMAYFGERKTLDMGGLNDVYLAHHPNLSVEDKTTYMLDHDPEVVVFNSWREDQIRHPLGQKISVDPRFVQRYELSEIYSNPGLAKFHLFVYRRRATQQ